MSRASELLKFFYEEHKNALVQYRLAESEADKVRKLRKMFSKDQLDSEEENAELDPHITIFYGLKDEDLPKVREGLKAYGSLGYTIGAKPIIFDNPKHDVLVLPVKSQCFEDLHKHIGNLCGRVPPTYREYKPHCTVSYLKKGTPYDHVKLPSDMSGEADKVEFSDTKDNSNIIQLR